MKTRRHHNNKGYRQIKNGGTHRSLQHIIRKLKTEVSMEYNIFYYVKLNGKKSTTVHIVSRTFSKSLPSEHDEALCGYGNTKRIPRHPVCEFPTYVRGWEFISNQLPANKKVKVCKGCLATMNKQMDEMF